MNILYSRSLQMKMCHTIVENCRYFELLVKEKMVKSRNGFFGMGKLINHWMNYSLNTMIYQLLVFGTVHC